MNDKKISIVGFGYVGLSNALMLSKYYKVYVYDIDYDKALNILNKKKEFNDKFITKYIDKYSKNIILKKNIDEEVIDSDFIILALPTNFNDVHNSFDTSILENIVIDLVQQNTKSIIVIKSTVPIGFTEKIIKLANYKKIIFSPEFLREGNELFDNLFADRFIVSPKTNYARSYLTLNKKLILSKKTKFLLMNSKEAESVKLFSNTYLASRVAFFNELDSFARNHKIDSKVIINGISLDKRIGNFYNNPSFGFGGYCLPKDVKQLVSSLGNLDNPLLRSISKSNLYRKTFLSNQIKNMKSIKCIGIYKLEMKKNSDNFRESAIVDVIDSLRDKFKIIIYDENISKKNIFGIPVEKNINIFERLSDIIITNRVDEKILKFKDKLFTPDLFRSN